jgi:hypothetical protein
MLKTSEGRLESCMADDRLVSGGDGDDHHTGAVSERSGGRREEEI